MEMQKYVSVSPETDDRLTSMFYPGQTAVSVTAFPVSNLMMCVQRIIEGFNIFFS